MRVLWMVGVVAVAAGLMGAAPASGPAAAGGGPVANPPEVAVTGKVGAPVALFNGKDLTGWAWVPKVAGAKVEQYWDVKNGVLHSLLKPPSTGYLATEKEYKNFVLTVEYRHLSKDNGGVFVCLNGEPKVWPDAIQVQGKWAAVGDLINQNSGMKKMTTDPARTKKVNMDVVIARMAAPAGKQAEVEKPLGEWNTLVITMENGNLSVRNNGILLNTAKDIEPAAGKIGLQAEGGEMEFRKIELTPVE